MPMHKPLRIDLLSKERAKFFIRGLKAFQDRDKNFTAVRQNSHRKPPFLNQEFSFLRMFFATMTLCEIVAEADDFAGDDLRRRFLRGLGRVLGAGNRDGGKPARARQDYD